MKSTILILLIVGISIATAVEVNEIEKDLLLFLKNGKGNPIDSSDHRLRLLDERLGSTVEALVWKGVFDDRQEVAVKISTKQTYIDEEIAGYRAANALNDPNIESKGIPRVYYTGKIFKKYPIIVITLFEETLLDRWAKQKKSFNAYSTLEVFLQMTNTLSYLQSRNVVHNDIKPENIFLRGEKVFLGDFDVATFNGGRTGVGSGMFASSTYWNGLGNGPSVRHSMDDLESLVYTIWYIERIHSRDPSGMVIALNRNNTRFVSEKCEHFKKLPRSYEAMKFISYDVMLSGKSSPDYGSILSQLTAAQAEVKQITGQKNFEWLPTSSKVSSLSFGYPGEDKPDGDWNPDWLYAGHSWRDFE